MSASMGALPQPLLAAQAAPGAPPGPLPWPLPLEPCFSSQCRAGLCPPACPALVSFWQSGAARWRLKEGQQWLTTPMEVARGISQGLANSALIAKVRTGRAPPLGLLSVLLQKMRCGSWARLRWSRHSLPALLGGRGVSGGWAAVGPGAALGGRLPAGALQL